MNKHIHKYKRRKIGRAKDYIVYACVLPNCRHYLSPEHLEGKQFICWRCGNPTLAGVTTKLVAKPHCKECTKGKNKKKEEPKSNFKMDGHLPVIDIEDLI